MVECKTYRFYDHVGVKGMRIPYREDSEVERWKQRDAIVGLERALAEMNLLSEADAAAVHEQVLAEIAEAIAFAEASPLPTIENLLEDVYTLMPAATGALR